MAADIQALIGEAQKRGLLNDKQLGLIGEAQKRGLFGDAPEPKNEGSVWDYVPVVSQALSVRDIFKQGLGPNWELPQSVKDRQKKIAKTDSALVSLAAGGAGGAAGAGVAVAKGAGLLGRMAGGGAGTAAGEAAADASEGKFQPKDIAESAAFGAVGQGVGEAISHIPGAVKHVLRGGTDPGQSQAAIDDLARFGATPSIAQATESPLIDAAESLVAKVPGGTGVIRKAAEETSKKLGQGIEDISTKLAGTSGADPEMAGIAVTKGIDGFVQKFRKRSGELFDDMRSAVPDGTPASVARTTQTLQSLSSPVAGAEATSAALSNPKIQQIAQAVSADAADGAMPFDQLLKLRSAVGRQLSDSSLIADAPRGELKMLYGALSDDIRVAAEAAGAGAQFARANNYYAKGMERVENFLDPLAKKNVPEQVFMALERGGKNGATQLRAIRKSVTPDQWRAVSAASIRRLGKATPGQQSAAGDEFSFNTFLTNWNRMDGKAKSVLFDGKQMLGVRSDLDAIARAATRIRESSQAFANPPNTASTLVGSSALFIGTGSALTGNFALPVMIGMASLASNTAAKLMTSPKFVKWLAKATKPSAGPIETARLVALAQNEEDEELQDAIQQFALGINQQGASE